MFYQLFQHKITYKIVALCCLPLLSLGLAHAQTYNYTLEELTKQEQLFDLTHQTFLLNQPMPNFKMEALDTNLPDYARSDLINGEPFLLTIWATWCPICEEEHHYLNKLARQGIRIVGLNTKDRREDALKWLTTLNNLFDINLYDEFGFTGLDLGVYGVPETLLIDGEGIIRYRQIGAISERIWNSKIAPLWVQYGGQLN